MRVATIKHWKLSSVSSRAGGSTKKEQCRKEQQRTAGGRAHSEDKGHCCCLPLKEVKSSVNEHWLALKWSTGPHHLSSSAHRGAQQAAKPHGAREQMQLLFVFLPLPLIKQDMKDTTLAVKQSLLSKQDSTDGSAGHCPPVDKKFLQAPKLLRRRKTLGAAVSSLWPKEVAPCSNMLGSLSDLGERKSV